MKKILWILVGSIIITAAPSLADSPRFDADGVYRIPFGTAAAPILACSPDKVCSLQLEANEIVLDKVSGDTTRWQIVTGVAGARANVPIIFFKPTDVGSIADPLSTNLIITTDRRIYEVRLQAVKSVSRTRYGFIYGGKNLSAGVLTPIATVVTSAVIVPRIETVTPTAAETGIGPNQIGGTLPDQVALQPIPTVTAPGGGVGMFSLDHNYRISGETNYKPVAVWNDGIRTYIQMQKNAPSPSIYAQGDDGRPEIVNMHGPINDVYAVDGLHQHILLIGAVGKKVPHIDIYRVR